MNLKKFLIKRINNLELYIKQLTNKKVRQQKQFMEGYEWAKRELVCCLIKEDVEEIKAFIPNPPIDHFDKGALKAIYEFEKNTLYKLENYE